MPPVRSLTSGETRKMKAVVKCCHHQKKVIWLSIILILTLNIDEIQEEGHQHLKKLTPTSSQTLSETDGVTPPIKGSEAESKPNNSHLLADEYSKQEKQERRFLIMQGIMIIATDFVT